MVTAGVYLFCRMSSCWSCPRRPWPRWRCVGALTALSPRSSPSRRTTSRRCWPTPPSPSSATCSWASGWASSGRAHSPPRHARLLQGLSLPRRRQRDARQRRRAEYQEAGRPRKNHAVDAACSSSPPSPSPASSRCRLLHQRRHPPRRPARPGEGYPWLGPLVYALGSFGAVCTAFYMSRAYLLTFEGGVQEAKVAHPHESWLGDGGAAGDPRRRLGGAAARRGFPGLMKYLGGPAQPVMENFLRPVFVAQAMGDKAHTLLPGESSPWLGFGIAWRWRWVGGGAACYLYEPSSRRASGSRCRRCSPGSAASRAQVLRGRALRHRHRPCPLSF